jgi:hypothetical protein
MNNNTTSSPSSPYLQAETTEGAGEGLDVTACSASLIDVQAVYENTKKSMEELETLHQEVMKTHQSIIDDCERVLHREQQ